MNEKEILEEENRMLNIMAGKPIICPICKGVFSRDKDHTCTCHKKFKEIEK